MLILRVVRCVYTHERQILAVVLSLAKEVNGRVAAMRTGA